MLVGVLAGLAAGALWGLVFVAPQLVPGWSAVDLVAGRYLSYGAAAAVSMLLTRSGKWPTAAQVGAAVGMSVLGFSGYYFLLVLAIRGAGVEVPTLIIGTIPVWVMLLGKPQGLLWRGLLPGLLLTASGVVLMMLQSYLQPRGEITTSFSSAAYWRGVGYAVLAMVCWTAFALLNAAWLKKHTQVNATQWSNWLGVASGLGGLGLWLLFGSEWATLKAQTHVANAVVVCIAMGVGSAWLATIFWNIASRHLSASLCGQLIVSETLFALLYAFTMMGSWPSALQITASSAFVLGIWMSILAHR